MKHVLKRFACALAIAALLNAPCARAQAPAAPKPTLENVSYGKHPRQVLDFYKANAPQPTPLLFFIHGGGWLVGDKQNPDFLPQCLGSGISVVSINYRLIADARADGVTPPVKACLEDAARALQFVRSKAGEWNVDKRRVAGCGGSAGACTSLWLACHPEMAEPSSADPVARESTRLGCVLAFVPQTTLDPREMRAWIPNIDYGQQAFGLATFQEFLDQRETLLPWIREYSPYALATSDDPPVYLFYDSMPALGQPFKDATHAANFGAKLAEKFKQIGVECEFNYPGAPDVKHPDLFGFLVERLKSP